jgi:heme exporter protein C
MRFLYSFASPKKCHLIANHVYSWLLALSYGIIVISLFWAINGVPPDYQQGETFKIIYFHVPSAFFSLTWYGVMSLLAIQCLVWRIELASVAIPIVAYVGCLMALIALVTGSLWGKPMWGTYWIWDARLTSELILFLWYIAILILSHTLPNTSQSHQMIAILVLIGALDLPIIHYSVYWWNSLHQGQTLTIFSKPAIAPSMLYPLLLNLLGFGLYGLGSIAYQLSYLIPARFYHQTWVDELFEDNNKNA